MFSEAAEIVHFYDINCWFIDVWFVGTLSLKSHNSSIASPLEPIKPIAAKPTLFAASNTEAEC
jgi:hypothetical protein